MKQGKPKLGVVEFFLDVNGIKAGHRFEAAAKAARGDKRRKQTILAALKHARTTGCDLVLFPGWTWFGDSLPPWLIQESLNRTLILELSPKNAQKRPKDRLKTTKRKIASAPTHGTYILHNGAVAVGPIQQYFGSGRQVEKRGIISREAQSLVDELDTSSVGSRHWDHPDIGRITILVCGEIMLVGGGGGRNSGGRTPSFHRPSVQNAGLLANWHQQTRLFLNPAHVTGMPQSVRDKRAWLADPSTLLATANCAQGTWLRWDSDSGRYQKVKRSAHSAAEAYQRKQRRPQLLHNAISTPSYCLRTVGL